MSRLTLRGQPRHARAEFSSIVNDDVRALFPHPARTDGNVSGQDSQSFIIRKRTGFPPSSNQDPAWS